MKIKILGTGCPNCKVLERNTSEAVSQLQMNVEIEKVTDLVKIIEYGVMSTPALVFDEKVISYGKVLNVEEIKKLLKEISN